jgi:hypothetical protein
MNRFKQNNFFCGAFVFLLLIASLQCKSQQTIFNVPSADIAQKREVFLQHESQFNPFPNNDFWIGTHYASVGIGFNTEIDTTLFNVSDPASNNIAVGLGFKSAIPILAKEFPEQEIKLTVGDVIPVSLQGQGVGDWTYGHLSFRVPKLKTRLSVGASYGTKQIFGRNAVSFIGGIEQPITKKISFIADYFSGTHALGFLIPGISYSPNPDLGFFLGYQIPNSSRCGSPGFVVEIAKHLRF